MRELWQSFKKRIPFSPGLPLLLALVAAVVATIPRWIDLDFIESGLYDVRMARAYPLAWQHAPSPEIVVISVDDHSARALEEALPLGMSQHARLLSLLADEYHPKGVGYLIDFNEVSAPHAEDREHFVEAARKLESEGRPVVLGVPYEVTDELQHPPYPLNQLPTAVAMIHKDTNVFSEDRVTRRALSHLSGRPAFHLDLAQRLGWAPADRVPRGAFTLPELDATYFFFRYHRDPSLPPQERDFHKPRGPYRVVPFADILHGVITTDVLREKLVLVAKASFNDAADFATTPYSRAPFTAPKALLHATIIDSIAQDSGIAPASRGPQWLATFLLTWAALLWVFLTAPIQGVLGVITLAAASFVGASIAFQSFGIWLRLAEPLFGIAVAYYLGVPYRLLREYQVRWDYQRKHELLTQVEELKTNFLSLITHDLKTPVARIQGLSEKLLRAHAGTESGETASHILRSTEELNRFITSLLELNRIESERVELRIASRDLDQILTKAIASLESEARAKRIQIRTELEPLFPVRVDADLLHKVFRNLLDNAIKYSPEGSHVLIRAFETAGEIGVSFTDRGVGLSEAERGQLFSRFYRAKNDATARNPGTGLGLYLSKYFVEAHGGRIVVQSEPDRGSTFTLYLPLEGAREITRPGLARQIGSQTRSSSHVEDSRR